MRKRQFSEAILVGKNGLLREGIAEILRAAGFRILASVPSADDLGWGKGSLNSALFLVIRADNDFEIALDQIRLFRSRYPEARIAIVSDRYRIDELAISLRAGANAYFVEVIEHNVFIKSLELVMMGETIVPTEHLSIGLAPEGSQGNPNEAIVPQESAQAPQLSSRELSILRCLIGGDSNKHIARKIGIAEATVKVHVKAIFRKIRVSNRTQAAIWGLNNEHLTKSPDTDAPAPVVDFNKRVARIAKRPFGTGQLQLMVSTRPIRQANHVEMARLDHLVPEHRQIVVTKRVGE